MPNLRIIHDNAADRAVLTASSQAGALGTANLQRDVRGAVLRAAGPAQTVTATWARAELVSCVALILTNLTSGARMRVRGYAQPGDGAPAIDTGWMLPCPEAPLGSYPFGVLPLGWNAYQWGGVNSWARGGGADAVAWFAPTFVRQLVIEVTASAGSGGYVEISRLVAGHYWSPEYNADYGASLQLQDSSETHRTAGGEQRTTVGAVSRRLSINLSWLTPADRDRLMRILRECSTVRSLLFSLYPEHANPVLEQDHMLYGRIANLDAVATPYFNNYAAPLQIEGI